MSVGAEQVQAVIEPDVARAGGRVRRLTRRDKLTLGLMCGIPFLLQAAFVWFPPFSALGLWCPWWGGRGAWSPIAGPATRKRPLPFRFSPPFCRGVRHDVSW